MTLPRSTDMRYLTFSHLDKGQRLGVLVDGLVVDTQLLAKGTWSGPFPTTLRELIDQGPAAWHQMADLVSRCRDRVRAGAYPIATVTLHAPLPNPPRNVFCVGRNYGAAADVSYPMFFTKATTAVTGPYDDITWDTSVTGRVDWEVELGVVIGSRGKDLSAHDAGECIFGYTVINDLTARDLQAAHGQFFKGKSLDGFCPTGPCVVTADEFGDALTKRISLRVNGVTKQESTTGAMLATPAQLLQSLSKGLTLVPGDMLATGSPAGSGQSLAPQEWLQHGDLVEAEIEGIGVLRNRVVAL